MFFVVIYATEGCMKCKLTYKQLQLPKHYKLMTDKDRLRFKKTGLIQAPVVEVYQLKSPLSENRGQRGQLANLIKQSVLVDSWNDFNTLKIKKWNEKYNAHKI